MKLGSEKSDTGKSMFKNLLGKMSDRKTLENKNRTFKFPVVNISMKKNSKISNSKKIDEKKSDEKKSGDRNLT